MKNLREQLERVPRAALGTFPTPLHRLRRLEEADGHGEIWIKRDDMTGLGPGGNKIRSLEFLLGDALRQGCDLVVAAGPLQSNLCALAAAACAKLGLECVLIHNSPAPARLEGNQLLCSLHGAESRYLGAVSPEEREAAIAAFCREARDAGRRPYAIMNGATSGRGTLGYARAVLELREQCGALGISDLTLYAPGGNGGVAAGLIYGNALLDSPFRVAIVSVEYDRETLATYLGEVIDEAAEIVGLPFPGAVEDHCVLLDQYRGGGWGENTPESEAQVPEFARLEGILLENVYTSKVVVGMRDQLRLGAAPGPACYLHTGGLGSLFSQY